MLLATVLVVAAIDKFLDFFCAASLIRALLMVQHGGCFFGEPILILQVLFLIHSLALCFVV